MRTQLTRRRGSSPIEAVRSPRRRTAVGAAALVAVVATGCGTAGDGEAEPPTTTATSVLTTVPDTSPPPPTTTGGDEAQDLPAIIDWSLDATDVPCEVSDLPGGPGGEAVVPATWSAGNADFVEFVVDDDLRPANLVRDVSGPGNVQVPCDPRLADGHTITIVASTGSPGDPGRQVAGETLIVTTTPTVDGGL